MHTVNIHDAKTHLSKLVDKAVRGEPFIIAKAGKPLVMVAALAESPPRQQRRQGFMAGQIVVPADFDEKGAWGVEQLFEGEG